MDTGNPSDKDTDESGEEPSEDESASEGGTVDLNTYEDPTLEAPAVKEFTIPTTSPVKIKTVAPTASEDRKTVTVKGELVYTGSLILVNPQNALKQDPADSLIKLYEHRASSEGKGKYQLANAEHTFIHQEAADAFTSMMIAANAQNAKCSNIEVSEAYRSAQQQEDNFIAANGVNAMKPNHSDFQTGYSMHLKYYDGTYKYPLSGDKNNTDVAPAGAVIADLADSYGFIQRYPAGKSDYTGLKDGVMPYLYRYVGVPHARVMAEGGYCLEEYIEGIKNYTAANQLSVTDGDHVYHVFYVPAAAEGDTTFEIPTIYSDSYTVSGNNVDGFIVTVTIS